MLVLSLKGYKSMTLVSLRVFRTNAMLRYLLWMAFKVIIKNTVIYFFLSRILKKLELHLDWSSLGVSFKLSDKLLNL